MWDSCEGPDSAGVTRCESTQLYIFDGRQRSDDSFGHANSGLTYLCVYHHAVAIGEDWVLVEPAIIEQGCADDPQLTVVDTLESVAAAAPALELTETSCSPRSERPARSTARPATPDRSRSRRSSPAPARSSHHGG